jgi:predicted peptidase
MKTKKADAIHLPQNQTNRMMPFRLSSLTFSICCLLIQSLVVAQPSKFSHEQYISPTGDTLKYRQLMPDAGLDRKFPLVIFLHGSGERGNDNESQLKWGASNFATPAMMKTNPTFVIAPQCPSDENWFNLEWEGDSVHLLPEPSKPMELLHGLILQAKEDLPIDPSRIYITGLSMGGFGTFEAMMRYPDLFAAAVPVCGGGDITKAGDIAHIPIWIATGAEDNVVDPSYAYDMIKALREAGAKPGLSMYAEVGHFSWIAAYSDPMIMAWMFRQRKK